MPTPFSPASWWCACACSWWRISLWAAITVRQQDTLIYLLALGVLLAGCGRLLSISRVGLPEPAAVWLGYLVPELVLPFVMAGAHYAGH